MHPVILKVVDTRAPIVLECLVMVRRLSFLDTKKTGAPVRDFDSQI